ncbi:MAG: sigma-70 family RNA polymerase sigma factor [Oscillospiraceae bacterium]|nr:sigma-70 family RNA polymerase sigma factor [Oscillospiraceae bacterium]
MEDEKILDLYWMRSESAILQTAKKYGHYCFAIAKNILQNNEDAKECENDTYLKTWESIPPQRPNQFRAFLGKITRNLSLNKYKEQRTKKRGGDRIDLLLSELEDCIPSSSCVEGECEAKHIVETINSFMLSLNCESRKVFVRRYWYGDSIKEVAIYFQMSHSKAKSILFRTRKALRTHLEKEGVTL